MAPSGRGKRTTNRGLRPAEPDQLLQPGAASTSFQVPIPVTRISVTGTRAGNPSYKTSSVTVAEEHQASHQDNTVETFFAEQDVDSAYLEDQLLSIVGASEDFNSGATVNQQQAKRAKYEPLKAWLPYRDRFLAEDLRWEGRGDWRDRKDCAICGQAGSQECNAQYRCLDCDGGQELCCKACVLSTHKRNPLHRIQIWLQDEEFFKHTTLKALGLEVQLGHPTGVSCRIPDREVDIPIIHTNGIHDVRVRFCNCETAQPHDIQLLRYGWFPATVDKPQTAATFQVLKQFHLLNFEGKVTAYQYYRALVRLSDNTGTGYIPDRYRSFLIMVREYRNLKMLKRAGRGHDPGGSALTRPGECALLCPACPQPEYNLPDDWMSASDEIKFLYCLFIAIDANFRLKRKKVSSESADPGLGDGWSYYVPQRPYMEHLENFGGAIVQPPSTCSNHQAVTAERSMSGLASTGVGTVDCSRHDFKRPISVGDLQKGERYVNMDYLFFSSLASSELTEYLVSYDIACQWSINLWERMSAYPSTLHVDHNNQKHFRFLVPKFHLPAHIMACQVVYSFNYNRYVGRTEGEAPERGWSHINPLAPSTREMGPGSRRDTLDDHFGDWNWQKTTTIYLSLVRDLKEARTEHEKHQAYLADYEGSDDMTSELQAQWMSELVMWERDHSQPNPFEKTFKAPSQAEIRKEALEEERKGMKDGTALVLHEAVSAAQLISIGLDLEEQQRKLQRDLKTSLASAHEQPVEKLKLQVRENHLDRRIESWIDIQHLYISQLRVLRSKEDPTKDQRAYEIKLHLPSSLPSSITCDQRLLEIEWRYRAAQANDALELLRRSLHVRSFLLIDKKQNLRGQVQTTRASKTIMTVQNRINFAAETYRLARTALGTLGPRLGFVQWEQQYPELKEEDVRPLGDPDKEAPMFKLSAAGGSRQLVPSEGRRTNTWIWRHLGDIDVREKSAYGEDVRIEWCKAKSRVNRWGEEVQLLGEEMRRVPEFFTSQASRWDKRANTSFGEGEDAAAVEGRKAYAKQQAYMFREMCKACHTLSAKASNPERGKRGKKRRFELVL